MRYQVRAIAGGQLVSLELEAQHAEEAAAQARSQGYEVLSTKRESTGLGQSKLTKFPLLLFSQELLSLLKAGLGLVESLEGIAEKEQRPEVANILRGILDALYRGQTLSNALTAYPHAFPGLYAAMIKASERTGDLPESLMRYIGYEQQVEVLRKKLVASSIYPFLLITVGGLVVLFLLGYVVPRFSQIYADVGDNQPWMLKVVLAWAGIIETHGQTLLIAAVAGVAVAIYALMQPTIRGRMMALLWRMPGVGEQMRVFQLARFYRTLGMLLEGGITVSQALEMARGLLTASFHDSLSKASTLIREGRSISEAMEAAGLVTPVSLRMLRVGEKSGEMGRMMEHIATLHDEEIARWLEWFTRLFEPLLMIFIGLIIGAVVVMLYMPIFELAGSLQ
ncbi:type II secretion system F family protein [Methylobacillus gramineus]|uniref:type II secretion system F family protein n=1 Tax=Methylobacillus gramineus TaxID=755169 RepID=UPI001CFF6DA7|nr:type II secretion system F family protein [Methylobacillus gramineus]MCB5186027.1 type II secretion system F family protein [Methylobacillus gramineus]